MARQSTQKRCVLRSQITFVVVIYWKYCLHLCYIFCLCCLVLLPPLLHRSGAVLAVLLPNWTHAQSLQARQVQQSGAGPRQMHLPEHQ
jgi:hypothetical protein